MGALSRSGLQDVGAYRINREHPSVPTHTSSLDNGHFKEANPRNYQARCGYCLQSHTGHLCSVECDGVSVVGCDSDVSSLVSIKGVSVGHYGHILREV